MSAVAIRTIKRPSRQAVPVLGEDTWGLAEGVHPRAEKVAALRPGLDLVMTLIDTAEMCADGSAEELFGEAMAGRRDEVFVLSKVLPHNATRRGKLTACGASRRTGSTLIHWRGGPPLDRAFPPPTEKRPLEML
jgi:aryl-alcohol dehydrogenase-like predicted oxidoreductase